MAVRSKMSTARSSGRATVKTTTEGNGSNPSAIANVSDADKKIIRAELKLKPNEDFDITNSMYDAFKKNNKSTMWDKKKGDNPFKSSVDDTGTVREAFSMLPKSKPTAEASKAQKQADLKAASEKVKPMGKLATLKSAKSGAQRDLVVKEKAAKEPISVPEVVSGPSTRTVTRKTLASGPSRKGAKLLRQQTSGRATTAGLGLSTATVSKQKGPRLSEKMKYKKEGKLAGARERVLGLSEVATEDQVTKSGKITKRGEKTPGSAQRLKELKGLYGSEREEAATGLTMPSAGKSRVSALKEAKSDIKQIGKLSKGQVKSLKTEGSAKGRAITKDKEMKAEYKAAKKPAKFSKGTSTENLAKEVAAMKSTKTPAEMKAMKTSAKSAMKEARGMTKTKTEKAQIKSGIKATRGVAKEARSYKGDIRKGLRMEKMDVRAAKVAEKTSPEKKAAKTTKGKTMRGTSYFTMDALNKTTSLNRNTFGTKQAGTKRFKN